MIIGIAGGSGSGKTSLANTIINLIGKECATFIQYDSYYRDRSHIPFEQRGNINYDLLEAFESELLIYHLNELIKGRRIKKPIYDFKTHARKNKIEVIYPHDIIIVEGILIFCDKKLRNLMDLKIFLDIKADIRLYRRIMRDVKERKRSIDAIINQWLTTVKPMYDKFVAPTREYSDIIYNNDPTDDEIEFLIGKIKKSL